MPGSPKRAFGHSHTLELFRRGVRAVVEAFKDTPALPVGDVSYRGGGRMRPHRSHKDGRDIDAGYYFKDGRARRNTALTLAISSRGENGFDI